MYCRLLCIALLVFSLSAMAAEDFQKTLADAGVKPEVIEVLVKNELTSRDALCLTTTEELTKIGILLGQAKLIAKFCTPEKPVESGDVNKLSELDLLNRLVADPKDDAALQALKDRPLVQKAMAKTPRWVVINPDKKLSAEETVKYLTFLNKDTAKVQSTFKGKRTTFVEAALGLESDVWVHPLFENKLITDGLDEFEVDWSGVRLEVLNALLWARKTAHKLFPSNLDGAANLAMQQRALADPLTDPALKKIMDDYKAALEEKDAVAMSVDVKKKVTETSGTKFIQSKTSQSESLEIFTNSIGMEFVLIPSGKFIMGTNCADDDPFTTPNEYENCLKDTGDGFPRHEVTITNPFYMGKYEVTQEQWVKVMGNNPSYFKMDVVGDDSRKHPVEKVSWDDAQAFVKRLNALEQTDKYRLPSEAEWEYAARANTRTTYFFGDDETQLGNYAWYDTNSGNKTHPVGEKQPNAFGLYDMYGNVWEWCQDTWHESYKGAPTDGSAWATGGEQKYHLLRGGSWNMNIRTCHSVNRNRFDNRRNSSNGFRLLMSR